jgi:hypothetical protein
LGDKASSSKAISRYLRRRGITATIPELADQIKHRRNRGTEVGGHLPSTPSVTSSATSLNAATTSSNSDVAPFHDLQDKL